MARSILKTKHHFIPGDGCCPHLVAASKEVKGYKENAMRTSLQKALFFLL